MCYCNCYTYTMAYGARREWGRTAERGRGCIAQRGGRIVLS